MPPTRSYAVFVVYPKGSRLMPLCNIIDHRKRPYRWAHVTAIIEPTVHDNSCMDSDQMGLGGAYSGIGYDERADISVAVAVLWAVEHRNVVTLYLYDLGDGIKAKFGPDFEHDNTKDPW